MLREISISEFIKLIKSNQEINEVEIKEVINIESMSELLELDPISNELKLKYKVIIKNSHLHAVDLRDVHFLNIFEIRYSKINYALFTRSKFAKGANFSTTTFVKTASFRQTWFLWSTYFGFSTFECEADFFLSFFQEWAMFHNATFDKKADFSAGYFKEKTVFRDVRFEQVSFSGRTIERLFIFSTHADLAINNNNVDFDNCSFLGNVKLNGIKCNSLSFSASISRGTIDLTNSDFKSINLVDAYYDVLLMDLKKVYKNTNVTHIDYEDRLENLKTILMRLKANYQKLCMPEEEDIAYRELRRTEYKEYKKEKNYKQFIVGKYFLDHLFGYGTLPLRTLLASILVIILYSILYLFIGINESYPSIFDDKFKNSEIISYLYFSTITFTTVGYGDISPIGEARYIAGTQGFIGVFMMAAFAVTFSRRLLR